MINDRRGRRLQRPGAAKPATRKLITMISALGFLFSLLSLLVAAGALLLIASEPEQRINTALLGYCTYLSNPLAVGVALFMALRLPASTMRWLAGLGAMLLLGALITLANSSYAGEGHSAASSWLTLVGAAMIAGASIWSWRYVLQQDGNDQGLAG